MDPNQPYNQLPLLPPEMDCETPKVLRQLNQTSRALAELKGAGNTIPNQAMLIDSVALQEAKDSSEIENIVTTGDDLYVANANALDFESKQAVKEVMRYREALIYGFQAMQQQPLGTNMWINLARIVQPRVDGVRHRPGTKIANSREIIYTPPEGERLIRDLLANLEYFIHNHPLDPLIKMAIMHYQFEAIHPFVDGNGRTGRILNVLYLIQSGLLDLPVLYLSRYIIENKEQYYLGLKAVTEHQAWEPWILYMLKAVEVTAKDTLIRIKAIRQLMDDTTQMIQERLSMGSTKELAELLFAHPYCKIDFIVRANICSRQTAAKYLKELEGIGVVNSIKRGTQLYYVNTKLITTLEG